LKHSIFIALALSLGVLGCDHDRDPQVKGRLAKRGPFTAIRLEKLAPNARVSSAGAGPGGQRPLVNPEALVPSQCYTKTSGRHNPCYVCHQAAIEGQGHENRMNDGWLQGQYGFSEFALTNRWKNLFVDRSAKVAAIGDEQILDYVRRENYRELAERMGKDATFRGWKPDLKDLELGAAAFDRQGFAKDGSRWVAINYMPLPSTFWPTNGSFDDVMIRLPEAFRTRSAGSAYVHDVYVTNLSILEAAIKNIESVPTLPIDERRVGQDLNGDRALGMISQLPRPQHYVGAASDVEVHTFLYPRGTEFLHTVRYVGLDAQNRVGPSPRMKEVRYLHKKAFVPKYAAAGLYDNEIQEKIEAMPPYVADFRDKGLDNGFGWLVQGYVEDKSGQLRPNAYEETLFCMGCHSTIGSTIDHVFSFARKVDGPRGWGYLDLRGMPDAPSYGEKAGQILTYLRRVGGGSEFRNNDEMQRRWFRADGTLDEGKVKAAPDVYALITPSRERAIALNKAYRVIVEEQSFLHGRDATVTPPENVFSAIDREVPPLAEDRRFTWDIRVAWRGQQNATSVTLAAGVARARPVSAPTRR
jgi:hypothetical protein